MKVVNNDETVITAINEIVKTQDVEQFYVCNLQNLIDSYENWLKVMPRVEPFYAVKCNDHPLVLTALASLGVGFDCASKGEISKVLSLGVSPKRIIFANPTKIESHIKYAALNRVSLSTFDSVGELEKIQRLYPKSDLVLRIKHDDKNAKFIFGNKFGCDPEFEALELLKTAKKLQLNVVGVSFHIGTGSSNPKTYFDAIKSCRDVFNAAENLGFSFNLLDIGGGFPLYQESSIDEIASQVNKALAKFFPHPSVKIISEPGTYLVESAFTLATSINSVKKILDNNGNKLYVYYINTGLFSGLLDLNYGKKIDLQLLYTKKSSNVYKSVVWGPTMDPTDQICDGIDLPELQINDWFVVKNMGAYTLALATDFNSISKPDVYGVLGKNVWKHPSLDQECIDDLLQRSKKLYLE